MTDSHVELPAAGSSRSRYCGENAVRPSVHGKRRFADLAIIGVPLRR